MRATRFRPAPLLPVIEDAMDFEKNPIKKRFTRFFVESFERMNWPKNVSQVFWAVVYSSNNNNVAEVSGMLIAAELGMSKSSVYEHLALLRVEKAIAYIKENVWMVDPSLVYAGPARYHRATRMQFRILSDQQPKDIQATNHERNDDEQCDLQARSGDPDPAHDAARAECA